MPYMNSSNAERLVQAYADMILRISYTYLQETMEAEDICQEVFLKLLSSEHEFAGAAHEKSWIIRTTINACKDRLRTSFWRRAVNIEKAAAVPAPEQTQAELMDFVMQLPRNWRLSIYLYYYEGYAVYEIAHLMGKSENAISAYLARGRKRLRAFLGEEENVFASENGRSQLKEVNADVRRF